MSAGADNTDRIEALCAELGADELAVLTLVAERLAKGRARYGELRLATDRRDFGREGLDEAADGFASAAMALVRRQRRIEAAEAADAAAIKAGKHGRAVRGPRGEKWRCERCGARGTENLLGIRFRSPCRGWRRWRKVARPKRGTAAKRGRKSA